MNQAQRVAKLMVEITARKQRKKRVDKRRGRKRNLAKTTSKSLISKGNSFAPRDNPVGKVEFSSSTGLPRNKQIIFKFEVRAKTQGVTKYATTITFNKVDFSGEKDKDHPLTVALGSGETQFIEKLKRSKHPVLVRCTCKDFFFVFGRANAKNKVLSGPDSFKYVRKTPPPPEGLPFKNPNDIKGSCKHIKASLQFLQRNKVLVN